MALQVALTQKEQQMASEAVDLVAEFDPLAPTASSGTFYRFGIPIC
jgi:hypothetical protein